MTKQTLKSNVLFCNWKGYSETSLMPRNWRVILPAFCNVLKSLLLIAIVLFFTGCNKSFDENAESQPTMKNHVDLKALTGLNEIKVMSFNIRDDLAGDPQTLDQRKGNILQVILDNTPDIVGVQELTADWMETWLTTQMATAGYSVWKTLNYAYSSPKAIYYKTSRFTMQSAAGFDI